MLGGSELSCDPESPKKAIPLVPQPRSGRTGFGGVMEGGGGNGGWGWEGGLDTQEEMLMWLWAGVQPRQLVLKLVDIPPFFSKLNVFIKGLLASHQLNLLQFCALHPRVLFNLILTFFFQNPLI